MRPSRSKISIRPPPARIHDPKAGSPLEGQVASGGSRGAAPAVIRASVFPISLALPWGLTIGPWPHLPVPAKLRYRVGEPIDTSIHGLARGADPSDAQVNSLDEQVRGAVQGLLDQLRDEARS